MRITAGRLRGRTIQVPDIPGLRPTPAKVRQALFNILGPVTDYNVLDLYAGSGIMALEALSRGAAAAVSVELHRKAAQAMRRLQQKLGLESWRIMPMPVEAALKQLSGRHFDLVFADPPYAAGVAETIPALLDQADIGCELLIVEESVRENPCWPAGWRLVQERSYGDTSLHFLKREIGAGEGFL